MLTLIYVKTLPDMSIIESHALGRPYKARQTAGNTKLSICESVVSKDYFLNETLSGAVAATTRRLTSALYVCIYFSSKCEEERPLNLVLSHYDVRMCLTES